MQQIPDRQDRSRRGFYGLACSCLLALCFSACTRAQSPADQPASGNDQAHSATLVLRRGELAQNLPEDLTQPAAPDPQTAAPAVSQAILRGSIVDEDDAMVPNAKITLDSADGRVKLAAMTGSDGHFIFTGVPPGAYTLTAESASLAPESVDLTLRPGDSIDLAAINLPPATTTAEINVVSSQHEAAEAELKEEEHQRLLGVLPNFYVSYNWHAAPLSAGQKWRLAGHALIDPTNFIIAGIVAGVQLENNTLPGYGPGVGGYFTRFAASYGDGFVGGVLGGAVLPILFHQDPRYFYRGTGTVRSRALYAIATAVISRGDNGKWQPAYASILGDFSAGAIANLYYPATNRNGLSLTLANGFLAVGEDAIGNLVQEFVFKHITPHTPRYPPPAPPTTSQTLPTAAPAADLPKPR